MSTILAGPVDHRREVHATCDDTQDTRDLQLEVAEVAHNEGVVYVCAGGGDGVGGAA
jgi:hypothetical protein